MAAVAGDAKTAREIHLKLLPVHRHLFTEPNPIPVKWALARMGKCGGTIRLPLTAPVPATQAALEQALQESGLL